MKQQYFRVGVIVNTHGIAGEVKVFPTTDDIDRFKKIKTVILEPEKENQTLHITGVKYVKNMVVLRFQEYNDINQVERLRRKGLFVTRKDAIPLRKGEYYIADLIGMAVFTTEGELLGELTEVIQTGANDVYAVTTPEGEEVLLPVIPDCIREVDLDENRMIVWRMPGL